MKSDTKPFLFIVICLVQGLLLSAGCVPETKTAMKAPSLQNAGEKGAPPPATMSYQEALAGSCFAPVKGQVVSISDPPGEDEVPGPRVSAQLGHIVTAMGISPDGKHLVSGGSAGDLKLWEMDSGREVWSVHAHEDEYNRGVVDAAFSLDGGRIYSVAQDGKGIMTWDPRTGKEAGRIALPTFQVGGDYLGDSLFTDQGTLVLLTHDEQNLQSGLFELPSGRMVREFKGWAVTVSPGGRYVITRGYEEDRTHNSAVYWYLWDACRGRLIKSFMEATSLKPGRSNMLGPSAFSPDGRYLAAFFNEVADDGKILNKLVLYEAASGKELWKGPVMENAVCAGLTFSGDSGRLFYYGTFPDHGGSGDWTVVVLDPRNGRVVRRYEQAVSPSGTGVFIQTPEGAHTVAHMFGKSGKNPFLFFDNTTLEIKESPVVQAAAMSEDRPAEPGTGQGPGGYAGGFPVAMMPDGTLLSYARLWNPKTGNPVRKTGLPPERSPLQLTVSPDGLHMIALQQTKESAVLVTRWDLQTGQELRTSEIGLKQNEMVSLEGLSPCGRYLLLKRPEAGRVVDMEAGRDVLNIQVPPAEYGNVWGLTFSPDGTSLAGYLDYGSHAGKKVQHVVLWDLLSGQKRLEKDLSSMGRISLPSFAFSPDRRSVLVGGFRLDPETGTNRITLLLLDAGTGSIQWKQDEPYEDRYRYWKLAVSPDGRAALTQRENGEISLVDMTSGQAIRKMSGGLAGLGTFLGFSPDITRVYAAEPLQGLRVWDLNTGAELARFMEFDDGREWLSMTPEGYYSSSEKGDRYLTVKVGSKVQGIGQYYNVFYRPDLVMTRLQGDPEGEFRQAAARKSIGDMARAGTPPSVRFVSQEDGAVLSKRDVEVAVEVVDTGGGIGKIEWKINGVTVGVMTQGERGIGVASTGGRAPPGSLVFRQLLTLSPGDNLIQVTAAVPGDEVASLPVRLNLICSDEISEKPSLYVITVGINDYRDGSLRLRYSVPDAKSIAEAFERHSSPVFEKIVIEPVFDGQATISGIEGAFNKMRDRVRSHDVFVLYMAGHGVAKEGRYYFLPHDFRYRSEESISSGGMTQDHLQGWLATIKARKSLVLLDTCNSGAFTSAEALQRGMGEKTAVDRLTRATGRAVIVAAKGDQPAMEGYRGHGIFTYALLEAMKNADRVSGNRDGHTSILEIAKYIGEEVPKITYSLFGYEQVPQMNLQGQDFPIAVTM